MDMIRRAFRAVREGVLFWTDFQAEINRGIIFDNNNAKIKSPFLFRAGEWYPDTPPALRFNRKSKINITSYKKFPDLFLSPSETE